MPFIGSTHTGAFFEKGGLPSSLPPNYSRIAVPYGQLGDMVSVSFFDQAAGRSFHDVLDHQKLIKATNTKLIEEWAILHGDSSRNTMEFDGLDIQLQYTVDYAPYLATGSAFALFNCLADACYEISEAGGRPRCLVMSYGAKNVISKQVLQLWYALRQTGGDEVFAQMSGGLSVNAWDFGWGAVDFIAERYLRQGEYGDQMYVLDDRSQEGANGGSVVQMVDLLAIAGYDLALIQTAYRYLVMEICALMVSIPAWQRKIINLTY